MDIGSTGLIDGWRYLRKVRKVQVNVLDGKVSVSVSVCPVYASVHDRM